MNWSTPAHSLASSTRRPPLRRLTVTAAGLILLLALSACSGAGNATELEVGDCFQDPDNLSEVTDVDTVECTEPHDNEVFLVEEQEDGDFPGDSELQSTAEEVCSGDGFEDYVGVPFEETAINAGFLVPSEELWDDGFRDIVCFAFVGGEELEQSVEDAGDEFPLGGASDDTGDDTGGDDSGSAEAGEPDDPPSIDDEALQDLADECFEGSGQACDDLFFQSDSGSEEEDYGNTCGGRFDESPGLCATAIGE